MLKPKSASAERKQSYLIERASLGIPSDQLEITPPGSIRPHLSHGIRRVTVGGAYEIDRGASQTLSFRFALHDALDPEQGYPENAQIEFMNIAARYLDRSREFQFDEFRLIKVLGLDPVDRFRTPLSYRVEVGMRRATHGNCPNGDERCLMAALDAAAGYSISIAKVFTPYLMPSFQASYGARYLESKFKIGAGGRTGGILKITDSLKAELSGFYHYLLFSPLPHHFEERVQLRKTFGQTWAIDASWAHSAAALQDHEWSLSGMYYF